MFYKLQLVFAACLPIALAGCGGKMAEIRDALSFGGGNPPPGLDIGTDGDDDGVSDDPPDTGSQATYRVHGFDVDHLEMTDSFIYVGRSHNPLYRRAGFTVSQRKEYNCNGNQCVANYDVLDGTRRVSSERFTIGESYDDFDGFVISRESAPIGPYSRYDYWPTGSNWENYGQEQVAGVVGQYSSIYAFAVLYMAINFNDLSSWPYGDPPDYRDDGVIDNAHAAAFGDRHERRPSASATWSGDMRGVDMRFGGLLQGNARLVYSAGANTIDLEISRVRPLSGRSEAYRLYSGSTEFVWRNLPVNSDGSFYMRGHSNDRQSESPHPTLGFVDGDFYGPNAAETAGVFERGSIMGAWLAER